MFKRSLTLLGLVAIALPAVAEFRTVERAYEVALSNFQAPATASGAVTMRTCDTCNQETVRVSASTRYEINHKAVALADFKQELARVQDRKSTAITVVRHIESDTITAVSVSL